MSSPAPAKCYTADTATTANLYFKALKQTWARSQNEWKTIHLSRLPAPTLASCSTSRLAQLLVYAQSNHLTPPFDRDFLLLPFSLRTRAETLPCTGSGALPGLSVHQFTSLIQQKTNKDQRCMPDKDHSSSSEARSRAADRSPFFTRHDMTPGAELVLDP